MSGEFGSPQARELWEAILERARQSWDPNVVGMWLDGPITPIDVNPEGQLVCHVTAGYLLWITRRYGDWLGKVVRELGAEGLRLEPVEPVSLRGAA